MPTNPHTWQKPDWHPDWGDPAHEFEALRGLALAIVDSLPSSTVALKVPEPGLMYLAVELAAELTAEVYSVLSGDKGDQRRFGIFMFRACAEQEGKYAASVAAAIDVLADWILKCE